MTHTVDDERPMKKCGCCKRTEPKISFDYGCVSCDKCIDYKNAYNKKKAEEIALLYPKTYCEVCDRYYRNVNWDKHLLQLFHKRALEKLNE